MFRNLSFNIRNNAEKGKESVEHLVDYLMDQPLNPLNKVSGVFSSFRVDAVDTGDSQEIYAELPGFLKSEITLAYEEDRYLIISADRPERDMAVKYICQERRTGHFERTFLIDDIDKEQIDASFENGVLRVSLPKKTVEKDRTVIDIG